jgi:hypothetical protein
MSSGWVTEHRKFARIFRSGLRVPRSPTDGISDSPEQTARYWECPQIDLGRARPESGGGVDLTGLRSPADISTRLARSVRTIAFLGVAGISGETKRRRW